MVEYSLFMALLAVVIRTIHKQTSNKFPFVKGVMIGFVLALMSVSTIMWILAVRDHFQ